ncbi:MAG: hypothetical protein AB7S48_08745 [Bacteroidales bacterium]
MNDVSLFIILIGGAILLFVLIREILNWYWKINKRIELQKLMLKTLLKIYEQNGGEVNWEIINKTIDMK